LPQLAKVFQMFLGQIVTPKFGFDECREVLADYRAYERCGLQG